MGIYSVIFWCGHKPFLNARLHYWPTFHLPVKKSCKKCCQKVEKIYTNDSNICQTFEKKKFSNTSKNNNQHSKKKLPTAWEKYCQTCAKNMLSSVGKKNVAKSSKINFWTNAWIKVTYNLKIYEESSKENLVQRMIHIMSSAWYKCCQNIKKRVCQSSLTSKNE